MSIKSRVINATAWASGGYVIGQALRLGSNLIMTRLLTPDMFGVMAISNTILIGLSLFSDFGVRQSIIQNASGEHKDFLNTAWAIQIVRGAVISLIVIAIGLALLALRALGLLTPSNVYGTPVLPYVLMALSVTSLLQGFQSTNLATASRNLSQKALTFIEIATQLGTLLTTLVWALIDRTIWALVAGNIAGAIVGLVLSHTRMSGIRNRWHWDPAFARQIFQFGKWIFLSTLFTYLGGQGIRLLEGAFVSAETLGYLSIAGVFAWSIATLVSRLGTSVAFPAFSEIARRDSDDLIRGMRAIQKRAVLVYFIGYALLFFVAKLLITTIYDARYEEVYHLLRVVTFNGVMSLLPTFYTNGILAQGDSRRSFILQCASFLFRLPCTYIGFELNGVTGMLYGTGVGSLLLYFYVIRLVHDRRWITFKYDLGVIAATVFIHVAFAGLEW